MCVNYISCLLWLSPISGAHVRSQKQLRVGEGLLGCSLVTPFVLCLMNSLTCILGYVAWTWVCVWCRTVIQVSELSNFKF